MTIFNLPVNYNKISPAKRRMVREQYIAEQGGKCSHCGHPLSGKASPEVTQKKVNRKLFPQGFFQWPVHLHHSHTTGMTIGAVHNQCNAVLWQYYGE